MLQNSRAACDCPGGVCHKPRSPPPTLPSANQLLSCPFHLFFFNLQTLCLYLYNIVLASYGCHGKESQWGSLNNRTLLSPRNGGWESEIRCGQGWPPLKAVGETVQSPGFRRFAGHLWCSSGGKTSPDLCLPRRTASPACVSISRLPRIDSRRPIPAWPQLN